MPNQLPVLGELPAKTSGTASTSKSTGIGSFLRGLFNTSGHRFKQALQLMEIHKQEVETQFEAIKSYTDHYGNILKTEEVDPKRLGNMKGVLTLNIDGARKKILKQREELETVLSDINNLSDNQKIIITEHNAYVDAFIDSLPEVYNNGQVTASIGGDMFRFDGDGKLAPMPNAIETESKPLII